MALMTTTVMVDEISQRIGPRSELTGAEGTPPGGRIIRAINDALLELILTYRIPQYEASPAHYIESNILTAYTGTNTANANTVTMSSNMATALSDSTIGATSWLLKFDDESAYHHITAVSGGGSTDLTVSPRVVGAHSSATCTLVQQAFLLPDDVYSIVDVRDLEQGRRIRHQDIRGVDKVQPIHGTPAFYSRWKSHLIMSPVVATPDIMFQVRYLKRPAYVSLGSTLTPLPEEWQECVVNLATAKVLASQGEMDRASWLITQVDNKAQALRSTYADSAEDFSFSIVPSRRVFGVPR